MPTAPPHCKLPRVLHAPGLRAPGSVRSAPRERWGTQGGPQGAKVISRRRPRSEPADPQESRPAGLHKQWSAYLQREHGRSVAHIAADNMALDGEHPAFALHVGKAVVAVVQVLSQAGAAQAARSVLSSERFKPERFKYAQALGLEALPASCDLNRPAANPRVPRGEGRAEGGASRRPRPSGKRDLWNPAQDLCAPARGHTYPLQTWVCISRPAMITLPQHGSFITRYSASFALGADHPLGGTPQSCCPKSSFPMSFIA